MLDYSIFVSPKINNFFCYFDVIFQLKFCVVRIVSGIVFQRGVALMVTFAPCKSTLKSDFLSLRYYRPQRSWAKVISLQASVCPHGGGVSDPNFRGGSAQNLGGVSEIFFSFFFQFIFPQKNFFWDAHPPPPPRRSMRGRYASYWNAFLY